MVCSFECLLYPLLYIMVQLLLFLVGLEISLILRMHYKCWLKVSLAVLCTVLPHNQVTVSFTNKLQATALSWMGEWENMVVAWKIEIVCIEKFVVQRCFLWKRREFLHTVDKKFGPVCVGKWISETQVVWTPPPILHKTTHNTLWHLLLCVTVRSRVWPLFIAFPLQQAVVPTLIYLLTFCSFGCVSCPLPIHFYLVLVLK